MGNVSQLALLEIVHVQLDELGFGFTVAVACPPSVGNEDADSARVYPQLTGSVLWHDANAAAVDARVKAVPRRTMRDGTSVRALFTESSFFGARKKGTEHTTGVRNSDTISDRE